MPVWTMRSARRLLIRLVPAAGASDVQVGASCAKLDDDGVGFDDGGWESNMTWQAGCCLPALLLRADTCERPHVASRHRMPTVGERHWATRTMKLLRWPSFPSPSCPGMFAHRLFPRHIDTCTRVHRPPATMSACGLQTLKVREQDRLWAPRVPTQAGRRLAFQ
jgi:hypothetical protein